ncbi:MAG: sulfite exporter TauE/SafE family protein [Actinobacteria bacterium]|nr:sulfite exporter TauE/SafE family protein [Actinomycetota bacterium]
MLDTDKPIDWKAAIIGLIAGLMAGLFGIGGGFVMVPLFVLWLGMAQKRAHATSLLSVAFIGVAALLGYVNLGQIDWLAAALVTIGAVCGIFLGVRLLSKVSERTLSLIFALVLLAAALRLLFSSTPTQIFHGILAQMLLVIIGFFSGTLAGLLGVGGGIVIIPALIICSGIQPEVARGTSLVVIVVTALVGASLHHRLGNIDHRIAVYAGIAGIPSAVLGAYIGAHIASGVLVPLFCLLLIILAGQLVATNRRN